MWADGSRWCLGALSSFNAVLKLFKPILTLLTENYIPEVTAFSPPPPPRETLFSDILKGLSDVKGLEVKSSDTSGRISQIIQRIENQHYITSADKLNDCFSSSKPSSFHLLCLCFSFDANETPVCRIALTLLSCCEEAGETIILHINSL